MLLLYVYEQDAAYGVRSEQEPSGNGTEPSGNGIGEEESLEEPRLNQSSLLTKQF